MDTGHVARMPDSRLPKRAAVWRAVSEQALSCKAGILKDLGAGINVNTLQSLSLERLTETEGRSPHRGPEQTRQTQANAESRF